MLRYVSLVIVHFAFLLFVTAATYSQVTVGQTYKIHSQVLNEDRVFEAYLPESYRWAQDRKYPVLYVLDGESQFLHTAVSADFLIANEEIPDLIVVGINSTIRIRDFTQTDWAEAWVGGGGAANFRKFLSSELIPEIEKKYRTDGFRILSGHSAGGQFALYCLTSEPALFHAYMALAPSLDWDHNLPQRSLEESFKKAESLKNFLYVARSDDLGRALEDYNRLVKTLETTSPKGFRWFSRPYPNETHTGMVLLAQIDALRQLYEGYHFHNDLIPKGFAYAEDHFRNVSEKIGWTLPVPEGVINSFGYDALNRDKVEEAVAYFRRNVKESPNSANAWDSLADGLERGGQLKDASGAAEKSAELARKYDLANKVHFERHAEELREKAAKQ